MRSDYLPDNVRQFTGHTARQPDPQEGTMQDDAVTRYELDARTEAIEARMDARIAHMEAIVEQAVEVAKEAKQEAKETRRHVTVVSWTVAGVIIAAVAVVMGAATAWQTVAYSDLGAHLQALSGRIFQLSQAVSAKK